MPKVAPYDEDNDDNSHHSSHHHHKHHQHHYGDLAHGKDRRALVEFEKYTIRDNELDYEGDQVQIGHRRYSGDTGSRRRSEEQDGEGRHHHHKRRSRDDEGHGDSAAPPRYPPKDEMKGGPPRQVTTSQASRMTTTKKIVNPKASKFIQCDVLAFVIALTYVLAVVITVLAVWCYRQDSVWNAIVHQERPFPKIPNEDFFSGHYLVVYEQEEGLRHAKKHLLRENRWFELMHLMFMSAFLILTIFQLAAYITRGDEDHSKLIICYYTVFGGLGLIIALFPLLSWHNQENNYKVATHYLFDFSIRVREASPASWSEGVTNATANDAARLGSIVKFCYDASQDGITFEKDSRYLQLFARKYRLSQLQTLGFCTHHKFKITNTILSTIFALFCCAIPCIFCFTNAADQKLEKERIAKEKRAAMQAQQRQQRPPVSKAAYDEDDEGERRRERRRERKRSRGKSLGDLSERELEEIEKFKRYIQGEDELDENDNN